MVTDAIADHIALWVAVGGACLGLLGVGPRPINSLTFIGASSSLLASLWLLIDASAAGGVLRFGGSGPAGVIFQVSPASATLLAVSAAIAALHFSATLAAEQSSRAANRWQVLLPASVNLALVVADADAIAIAYLGATLAFNAFVRDRPWPAVIRTLGALLAVAGILIHSGRIILGAAGATPWSHSLNMTNVLLTLGALMPVIAWRPMSSDQRQNNITIAVPYLLSAALVLHFPPTSGGSGALLGPIGAAIFAVTWGFVALRSSVTDEASTALAACLHALVLLQWFPSRANTAADLATFGAAACTVGVWRVVSETSVSTSLRRVAIISVGAALVLLAFRVCDQLIHSKTPRVSMFPGPAPSWVAIGLGITSCIALGAAVGVLIRLSSRLPSPELNRSFAIEALGFGILSAAAMSFSCAHSLRAIAEGRLSSIFALLLALGSIVSGVFIGRRASLAPQRRPILPARPGLFAVLIRGLEFEPLLSQLLQVVGPRRSISRARLPSLAVCAFLVATALAAVLVLTTSKSVASR